MLLPFALILLALFALPLAFACVLVGAGVSWHRESTPATRKRSLSAVAYGLVALASLDWWMVYAVGGQ